MFAGCYNDTSINDFDTVDTGDIHKKTRPDNVYEWLTFFLVSIGFSSLNYKNSYYPYRGYKIITLRGKQFKILRYNILTLTLISRIGCLHMVTYAYV